jgi:hypothetical protein
VLTIIVIVIVIGVAYVAGVRHANPLIAPPPGGAGPWRAFVARRIAPAHVLGGRPGTPQRATLTMALFRSLADPANARASDGAVHVEAGAYEAICSERDAAVIRAAPASFAHDLNALVEQNRSSLGLRSVGRIAIRRVTADDRLPDDAPCLRPLPRAGERVSGPDPSDLPTPLMPVAGSWPASPRRSGEGRSSPAALIPRTRGLGPIPVRDREQRLGRNPHHGPGLIGVASVSWDHAAVSPAAGRDGWEIRDLSSRHGTRVNGRDVRSDRARPLANGDVIELGPDAAFIWTTSDLGYSRTGT